MEHELPTSMTATKNEAINTAAALNPIQMNRGMYMQSLSGSTHLSTSTLVKGNKIIDRIFFSKFISAMISLSK
jgi:hypothetical protein